MGDVAVIWRDLGSSGQGNANPVAIAPIPQCRSGITQTSVFPPNDTLICDPSGTRSSQLMTAVSMQNYGVNSYMIRQPFDFAGRTGKIVFDVDAVDQGGSADLSRLNSRKIRHRLPHSESFKILK